MNAPTDWTSAIAILVGGLLLGVMFAYIFGRRRAATIGDNLAVKDLEAKRDALIAQLRDESLTQEERERLEAETADVLRRLDAAPSAAPVSPARPPMQMNPTVKGFLYGAASFAALAALGFFVYTKTTPRQEGGSLTGNLPNEQPQQQQQQQADPALMQLQAAVQRDPNNLQLRNDLAQAYLERDNMMAVFEQTEFVLAKAPTDSRALTFQALVRMAMGDQKSATDMLQRATKSDPQNLDSWVALAWVYTQQDKMSEAEAMIAEAKRQSPSNAARLDEVFTQMKAQAKVAAGGPLPEGHPPVDGATPAPSPAASSPSDPRALTVTVDLDPAARAKNGVLFVMARNPMGGPPVAVKRIMVSSFPITFALSQADSMMGQPLPDKFRLEARLDSDGDAMTKVPTDPTAMAPEVTVGTSVRLALK